MMKATRAGIIIGSAPSSGSTLLVNIIGRAPQVFQCGELSIFDKRDWIVDEDVFSWIRFARLHRRGYRRRLACEMSHHLSNFDGLPESSSINFRESSYLDHCEWLMNRLADHHQKSVWVEKTPANIFSIEDIAERRPEWRHVVMVRDPRSVLLSLSRRGYSKVLAAARWYLPNLVALKLAKSGRAILVRYEDLIEDPKTTVRNLFAKLNIGYSDSLLTEPKQDAFSLESWTASPADAPTRAGLWANDKRVPGGYLEALGVIHPSSEFISAHKLNVVPNAVELAAALGYEFAWEIDQRSNAHLIYSVAWEYMRYAAAMLRRLYIPRLIPFYFE